MDTMNELVNRFNYNYRSPINILQLTASYDRYSTHILTLFLMFPYDVFTAARLFSFFLLATNQIEYVNYLQYAVGRHICSYRQMAFFIWIFHHLFDVKQSTNRFWLYKQLWCDYYEKDFRSIPNFRSSLYADRRTRGSSELKRIMWLFIIIDNTHIIIMENFELYILSSVYLYLSRTMYID